MPLLNDGNAESKVRQGVTLDVIGESTSVAPRDGTARQRRARGPTSPATGGARAEGHLDERHLGGLLPADSTGRDGGTAPGPATAAQLERMKQLAARSMQEGAWGLVTSFESGGPELSGRGDRAREGGCLLSTASTCRTSAARACSRTRNWTSPFASPKKRRSPSTSSTSRFAARRTGARSENILREIEAARARGLDVTANQYPYTAMQHGWSAFFPGLGARGRAARRSRRP